MTVGEHLATLQAELEEFKRARRTGVARVSYEGKNAEYRSEPVSQTAIAGLEAEIDAAFGTQPVRTIVVRSSKRW
jgi:hypothetical protein